MVRFGVAGVGVRGVEHAQLIFDGKVPGAEVTAVCDTDPGKLEAFRAKHPGIATYENTTAMIAGGGIDAVLIATPHYDHPAIAMEAFAAGLHVMNEKPAGVYTQQVRAMDEAYHKTGKARGLVYGIMYNQRTNPIFRKMRDMVQGGALGALKRTSWLITDWYRPQAYYDSGGWRATWKGEGGGVLINQCPHNLDLWQWICGMPQRVHAFTHMGKWHDIEVEDDVTAYVEYENGATGIFITSTADCPGNNRFEVLGDKGKLVFEHDKLTHYKLATPEREFNRVNREMFAHPAFESTQIDCPGEYPQHEGVLRDFVRAIKKEGELVARGEEGIHGLMISNAMHLSGWLGKTVELPLDEDLFLAELKKQGGA
ncbi:MAG: Gfo/Idh/MocA family oxidoreductase [Defluviitaleaceae bacterium]|nr:Gfo/Idh/MocA family oxidoreductase [Defluviitaleaceae bacterium]MCL2240258.1 Gfo/Idh/MocA family oxidoreductase [Defluviitaleaceae bacterium]